MPRFIRRLLAIIFALVFCVLIVACSPEVGSEEWCEDMKEKSKGDWTANQAGDFAKHCILGLERLDP